MRRAAAAALVCVNYPRRVCARGRLFLLIIYLYSIYIPVLLVAEDPSFVTDNFLIRQPSFVNFDETSAINETNFRNELS